MSEVRINKLNTIWLQAAELERAVMKRSTDYIDHLSAEIPRNNPALDSMMFLRHNIGAFQEPGEFSFEPCPVWHDDEAMITDDNAKNFLRNLLLKSKSQFAEARRDADGKRREVETGKAARQKIREGKDNRDEVDVVKAIFLLQDQLHEAERKRITAEVEVSTITHAVGDVSLGAQNHEFKAETFKIPTNCDYCGDRIWGLSAKGFSCKDCGYTCHSKCEMKVPAECPGEQSKEEKKRLKVQRQEQAHIAPPVSTNGNSAAASHNDLPSMSRSDTVNSMNTLSSGFSATAQRSVSGTIPQQPHQPEAAAPEVPAASKPIPAAAASRRHRVVAPPPTSYAPPDAAGDTDGDGTAERKGKMLYAFEKSSDGEITVHEGREVILLEPDGKSWRLPTGIQSS